MKWPQIGVVCVVAGMYAAVVSSQNAQNLTAHKLTSVSVRDTGTELEFQCGEHQVAAYIYSHDRIWRPFFANLCTPGGIKVSRNFPPLQETDLTDHETMHPGAWLAFGDINGNDFWRNQAKVEHVRFTEPPIARQGVARFVEQKDYLATNEQLVCNEVFRCTLRALRGGALIEMDSTFTSSREFYFGDQEEMGFGIRVATAITEKRGGQISDSEGRVGARQVWSQPSAWCNYSGAINDQKVGMAVLCHPDNFRNSWMHARDYGLIAANPFGRAAMGKGGPDKTVVAPGKSLRLRYGLYIYEGDPDLATIYQTYLQFADQP